MSASKRPNPLELSPSRNHAKSPKLTPKKTAQEQLSKNKGILYGKDSSNRSHSVLKKSPRPKPNMEYRDNMDRSLNSIERVKTLNSHKSVATLSSHPTGVEGNIIKEYWEELKKIFVAYATYGEATTSVKLNSASFQKLLRESGVMRTDLGMRDITYKGKVPIKSYLGYIRESNNSARSQSPHKRFLSSKDAELLFLEFSRIDFKDNLSSHSKVELESKGLSPELDTMTERIIEGKMSFEDFIKALRSIALKLYSSKSETEALEALILRRILVLLDSRLVQTGFQDLSYIGRLKEILKSQENVAMLGILYRNIQIYYMYYTGDRKEMDFKSFCTFFKDFEIYPLLVSATLLSKYFSALASLNVPLS